MMVARSGMFVAPLAGTPPVGMSPTDGRIAFSSVIGTTPQVASGGAITQSASTMAITVAAAVWQLPDVSNAAGSSTFLSATDLFTPTPAAGPATGSRIDLIVVKQNNVENADADSRANVVLVAGTAGAPGVAPSVPAGAYLYATVNVPTSAANAAACTVVVARPTTYAQLPLKSATLAALSTASGSAGSHAAVTADATLGNNGDYQWTPAGWSRSGVGPWLSTFAPVWAGTTETSAVTTFFWRIVGDEVEYELRRTVGAAGILTSTHSFTLPVPINARVTSSEIIGEGSTVISSIDFQLAVIQLTTSTARLVALNAAGAYVKFDAVTNTIPSALATGNEIYIVKGRYSI